MLKYIHEIRHHGSIVILVITLLALPLTVFVTQQQQETRQRAAETVSLQSGNYGVVNQSFGIVVSQLNDSILQNIVSTFPFQGVFIQLEDPDVAFLNSNYFSTLSTKGFNFYFTFTKDENAISAFLNTLFNQKKFSKQVIVEIANGNVTTITNIKTQFSEKVLMNAPLLRPWYDTNAISSSLDPFRNSNVLSTITYQPGFPTVRTTLFSNIRLLVDTYYDMVYDVPSQGYANMDIPETISIGVTDMDIPKDTNIPKNIVKATGALTSAITIGREAENGNQTKITQIFSSDFANSTLEEQKILSSIADFILKKPTLIWPQAFKNNGGPYDYAPFGNSETDRIVGVIGKTGADFYAILSNTSDSAIGIDVSGVNFAGYQYHSTTKGNDTQQDPTLTFSPYETIVLSKNLQTPTLPPSPPATSTTPSPSGTSTTPTTIPATPTPTTIAIPGSCSITITGIDESAPDKNTLTLTFRGIGGTVYLQLGQKGSTGNETGNPFDIKGYFSQNLVQALSIADQRKLSNQSPNDYGFLGQFTSDSVLVNGIPTDFKIYEWDKKFKKNPQVPNDSSNSSDFVTGKGNAFWYYIDECNGRENGVNKECTNKNIKVSIPKNINVQFMCSVRDIPSGDILVCHGNPICSYNDGPDIGAYPDKACNAWKRSCSSDDSQEYIQGITRPGNGGLQFKVITPEP